MRARAEQRRACISLVAVLAVAAAAPGAGDEGAANPGRLTTEHKNGFLFATEDGKFSLRLAAGLQFRYTYLRLDESIKGNETEG